MLLTPDVHIAGLVDLAAVRHGRVSRSGIFLALGVRHDNAVFVAKDRACDAVQSMRPSRGEGGQQFRHGGFAFADDDHIGSRREIFAGIIG